MERLDDLHIASNRLLRTPASIKSEIPLTERAAAAVSRGRNSIQRILEGEDRRLLVIVGPCSIHDPKAAIEYARRLKALADEVSNVFEVVMRVYFEKPRTTTGWKGLINDPFLNDSFEIDKGLLIARRLLLEISELGLPIATEALDPVVPQYLGDLVSWTAIGARTAESQTHREMASGLSTPIGFKNGTDGNVQVAVSAITAAAAPHRFLGINQQGQCSVYETRGNRFGHVVLRGGSKPNYDAASVADCEVLLTNAGLRGRIMVDCSHGNSLKKPERQGAVFRDVVGQIVAGNRSIIGCMLESNLHPGRQNLGSDPAALEYGVSITDGCIGWDETAELLRDAAKRLKGI